MAEEGERIDYLETTKGLVGIAGDGEDALLNILIAMTVQSVVNYCNLTEVPEALDYAVCRMAADAYVEYKRKASGEVSSVSEDGRSVSFGGADMNVSVNNAIARNTELSRYKKLFRV